MAIILQLSSRQDESALCSTGKYSVISENIRGFKALFNDKSCGLFQEYSCALEVIHLLQPIHAKKYLAKMHQNEADHREKLTETEEILFKKFQGKH